MICGRQRSIYGIVEHGATVCRRSCPTRDTGEERPMPEHVPVTMETVRQLALALPGVEEGTSYGTPAFRVRGRFLARLHDDGVTLVIRTDEAERTVRMLADPETFSVTPHYAGSQMLLVRLATVDPEDLRDLIVQAWRSLAPKRLTTLF